MISGLRTGGGSRSPITSLGHSGPIPLSSSPPGPLEGNGGGGGGHSNNNNNHSKNVNPIPAPLQKLFTQLEFFAMLETDKKPNLRTMTFSDANSYLDALYRGWYNETKENVVQRVRMIVNETLDALNDYQHTEFIYILIEKLRQFRRGVLTLLDTYHKYPKVVSDLKVVIDNIDLNLKNQHDFLNSLNSSSSSSSTSSSRPIDFSISPGLRTLPPLSLTPPRDYGD